MPNQVARAVKKWMKYPVHKVKRYRAKSSLQYLTSHKLTSVQAVGNALHDALHDVASEQECELMGRIEQRRNTLLNMHSEIVVVDYGAGRPSDRRSLEEMDKGVKSSSTINKVCRSSKPEFWCSFLFKLIQNLHPIRCVELGSCVGISASYQATALRLNNQGMLVTLEGSPEVADIARQTLNQMDLDNTSVITGPFHTTLEAVLGDAKQVDFLFNDGHHDHDAVIRYFNIAVPYLSDEAMVVFDDINWSPGMRNAWDKIENDPRVAVSIDLHEIGIALVSDRISGKEKIRIPL
ncbi:putative S-adenosylmethionine-dependent methyltransferase [Vibrio nigripulchritudo SFn27]|uniref:Putative S-adenosylmethionine-dependent methyltransferase n=1 Tax=Vibrio nigripulchritudo TaxID=28173 RepID=U4K9D6_9VIBR|nr:class I SAM-dependent methyltransferase [Vibrio nigripulchritudo]CCN83114.1 putative S-adenosylmethionine-dependent methyltransferase [Vibrio nigripulchritudo BLFn1]CCN86282.1 putative S-adenosylmethionine-dependent methyltransferase [Vibrio nigripulchritudo SFn27]CCN92842.1 putative S-adenosylmethionine-dependent methyltransferase [Vibrio nigripulchritudo ENn2]CCO42723.1 putative S-adenosylmethionine-dependent methyltransferase [Vibrio nigripulchritudo SFn135]CCO52589.1 putative S-adenosyl